MKKKLGIVFLFLLLFVVGCKKEDTVKLSAEDQDLVWQKKQDKGFGKFDYIDVTQKEASKLMEEKFNVKLPKLYTSGISIMESTLQTDENIKEEPVFSVEAIGDTLLLQGTYSYKNKEDGKCYSYGTIELVYEFDQDKKQVKLNFQGITLVNYPNNQKVYINDPAKAVEQFGKLVHVTDLKKRMTDFEKELSEPADKLQNKQIKLISSFKQAEKDHEVGRNIGIEFGENGTLSLVRFFVKDYSE
ncbi:hypothetical protein DOK67_0001438 [Enterococcus sp. DIV0212c]|uniref:hypothetical protein n=1 Tax=Enterococcus sp. DIV0212c TaxID=2230867 RepID=UPI001A9AD40A|nr:hypothetical protein [Enterococcus sp. DIV0212c]MBO1354354.1 hypothetical protein [Enterococcus sp. DIV0212c]